MYTGDGGVIHPDGYLEVKDRFKDLIISGGENIVGTEVENIIYEHPDVDEVVCFGKPDPKWGEPSKNSLDQAFIQGSLIINEIIYAELAPQFAGKDLL